ncbi:MAG: Lrp/AsnC family transcriptional regulator [Alphaproteobacteria bacterium]
MNNEEKDWEVDDLDRKILREVQRDADQTIDEIAGKVGSSRTPVWNRLKKLRANGVIERTVCLINSDKVGLGETFFVSIRTDQHSHEWLEAFKAILRDNPEIQEVHRLTGDVDYIMKVKVANSKAFDAFYRRFIGRINLFNVTSALTMETLKESTELAL